MDAKSLIEMMMKGATGSRPSQAGASGGGLGDLLGQILAGAQGQGGNASRGGDLGGLGDLLGKLGGTPHANAAPSQGGSGGLGGLGDLLGKLGGGAGQQAGGGSAGAGGLDDILRKVQEQLGGAGGQGGGLMDILGKVLSQATQGVKEGAGRIDSATGASDRVREATGRTPEQMLEQLKELIQQNQGAAMAGAGGLGAVVLGTRTGRALAGQAIKLGGLALIGGLAYKALQNYQSGKPLIAGAMPDIAEAPRGSGFETAAVTQQAAVLYLKTMIAAAAADGRIDAVEQQKIMGNLKQLGIDREAEEFLANELNNPATAEQIAAAVTSEEEAVQVFTAARIAVDLDNEEEHAFLVKLAGSLGLDGKLVSHIDATARAAS